jgi:DNA polymerase I
MGLYTDHLLPAANFLRDVEMQGMIYDVDAAADMWENEVNPELGQLKADMRAIAGLPLLNPGSPIQAAALYYDTWGIQHEMQQRPAVSGRTFERSVDDFARRVILEDSYTSKSDKDRDTIDKFTRKLDRYKKLGKINSTYIIGLVPYALEDPEQRVYTNINLHTTETGRTSSTDPNLQNIVRPKPGLPDIRKLFKSSPGRMFVQADYSQAELRVIAQLSQDVELLRVYEEGLDLHTEVAIMFYGPNYTTENRQSAKNMDFGVAYRISAKTFKMHHGIPVKEGQKFIEWWWDRFSGVARWEKMVEKQVHANTVTSPFERRRRFYLITDQNKEALYREAINFYPQSTASDLTLLAGIMVHDRIDSDKAAIVLLVHDSIMADVATDYVDEFKAICKEAMESVAKIRLNWDLPFLVDIAHGLTWGDAK